MDMVTKKGFENCLRFLKVYKELDGYIESISVKPIFKLTDNGILRVNVKLSGDIEIESSISKKMLEKVINYMKPQIGVSKNDDLIVSDVVFKFHLDKKIIRKKELLIRITLEPEKVMVGRFPPVNEPYVCIFSDIEYDLAGIILKTESNDLLDIYLKKEDIEKALKEFIKLWITAEPEFCEEFLSK